MESRLNQDVVLYTQRSVVRSGIRWGRDGIGRQLDELARHLLR